MSWRLGFGCRECYALNELKVLISNVVFTLHSR